MTGFVTPAWILGNFNKHFNRMMNREINPVQFYDLIKDMPEVPQKVKDNWKSFAYEWRKTQEQADD